MLNLALKSAMSTLNDFERVCPTTTSLDRSYVFLICFPNEEGTYFFKKQGVQIKLINPVNSHQLHHALRMTEMWLSPLHKPRRYISCSRNRVNTFSGINNRTPTTEWGEENVCSVINNCKLPKWNLFFSYLNRFFFFFWWENVSAKSKMLKLRPYPGNSFLFLF